MTESPEDKIIRLMRDGSTGRMVPAPQTNFNVTGNGNFIAGGDFHLHQEAPKPVRPKIVVQTGVGVIDAKQKAELTRKLTQWLTARNAIRKDKMSIQAARKAMNDAVGVNSYHEMTPEQFVQAIAWIARQRSILTSMKSAPTKIDGFRATTIGAIKARSKQLGDLNFYRPHIVRMYGLSSLAHLSDRQLQELREWVFRQKR